jgi:hypothetical protein
LNAERRPRECLTFKEVGKLVEGARSRGRYGRRQATMILIAHRRGLRGSGDSGHNSRLRASSIDTPSWPVSPASPSPACPIARPGAATAGGAVTVIRNP